MKIYAEPVRIDGRIVKTYERNFRKQKIKSFYDNTLKKNPKAFEELEKEFYKTIKEKQCDYNLCNYVWKVLISVNKG